MSPVFLKSHEHDIDFILEQTVKPVNLGNISYVCCMLPHQQTCLSSITSIQKF